MLLLLYPSDSGLTMSTIFLDRDGVINENRSDYIKSWSEFCFLPGSKEAMAMLTHAVHRIIVCTNQAGIGRWNVSRETVEEIHRRMIAEIAYVRDVSFGEDRSRLRTGSVHETHCSAGQSG